MTNDEKIKEVTHKLLDGTFLVGQRVRGYARTLEYDWNNMTGTVVEVCPSGLAKVLEDESQATVHWHSSNLRPL